VIREPNAAVYHSGQMSLGDHIKEDELGMACGVCGRDKTCIQNSVQEI
jgi:predicted transcriptional regulator